MKGVLRMCMQVVMWWIQKNVPSRVPECIDYREYARKMCTGDIGKQQGFQCRVEDWMKEGSEAACTSSSIADTNGLLTLCRVMPKPTNQPTTSSNTSNQSISHQSIYGSMPLDGFASIFI